MADHNFFAAWMASRLSPAQGWGWFGGSVVARTGGAA